MNTSESSLTAPYDRDLTNKWRPDQESEPLSASEGKSAVKELHKKDFVQKFPKIDRTYADPGIMGQKYTLVSFIPSKNAVPDEKGVYGFVKSRGNYETELEADQRAEYLIRNYDSYHSIYTGYVGRPFPLTQSSEFSKDTSEIDIRKQTTEAVSSDVRAKKEKEEADKRDILEREEKLLAEHDKEEDPFDIYITNQVKKAQLSWTYNEHIKKMREVRGIVKKCRLEIEESEKENPDFSDKYFEKYMQARKDAGFKEKNKSDKEDPNFIEYMIGDIRLDFDVPEINERYEREFKIVDEEQKNLDKKLLKLKEGYDTRASFFGRQSLSQGLQKLRSNMKEANLVSKKRKEAWGEIAIKVAEKAASNKNA